MAVFVEGRRLSEAEPLGLLTEGAAGIAAIVLAIIALAGTATAVLAAIATIVIGVGLIVQAFNTASEQARMTLNGAQIGGFGDEALVDFLAGATGIVLGILSLIGIHAGYLIPAALIVFGAGLILSGAAAMQTRGGASAVGTEGTQLVSYRGPAASSGFEVLAGLAVTVLGILSLVIGTATTGLVLVGFIVVGAALLMVSASFSGAVMRLMATAR